MRKPSLRRVAWFTAKYCFTACSTVLFFGHSVSLVTSQESASKEVVDPTIAKEPLAKWVENAQRILDIASEEPVTEDAKKKLNKELVSLKPKLDDDPRYVYAMVLASMKEKRWTFANDFSTDFLKNEKSYIPIRVANVRSLFLQGDKKLLPAIAELELLAKGLANPDPSVTPDQMQAAAKYLGLAVGYVEGPCKDLVKATIINDLVEAAERIPESLQEPFLTARETIGEEYRVLIESGEEGLKKLRAGVAEDTEKLKMDLEEKRKLAEKKSEDNKKRLETRWNEAKANWEGLYRKSQDLSNRATVLQLRRQQLVADESTIIPPQPDAKGNINPVAQQRYFQLKNQWDNSIAEVDITLGNISVEYNNTIRQGMVYENQLSGIRSEAQREGMNFEMEKESFSKMERIVKAKESKAKEKAEVKIPAGKLRHARAYTTYDDFNFFKEKSLLIDSFPTK